MIKWEDYKMANKIVLKRNEETGLVEAFKGDDKVGEVVTMGDQTKKEVEHEDSV